MALQIAAIFASLYVWAVMTKTLLVVVDNHSLICVSVCVCLFGLVTQVRAMLFSLVYSVTLLPISNLHTVPVVTLMCSVSAVSMILLRSLWSLYGQHVVSISFCVILYGQHVVSVSFGLVTL